MLKNSRSILSVKLLLSGLLIFSLLRKASRSNPGVKSPADISCAEREPCFRVNTFQGTKRGKKGSRKRSSSSSYGAFGAQLKRALTYQRHEMRRVKDEKSGAWRVFLSLSFSLLFSFPSDEFLSCICGGGTR